MVLEPYLLLGESRASSSLQAAQTGPVLAVVLHLSCTDIALLWWIRPVPAVPQYTEQVCGGRLLQNSSGGGEQSTDMAGMVDSHFHIWDLALRRTYRK